jgi:hypothetical protein
MKTLISLLALLATATVAHASNQTLWVNTLGTVGDDDVKAIAVAPDGTIFTAGNFSGPLDGLTPQGASDVYLRKISPTGQTLWTKSFPSSGWAVPSALAIDPERNRLYIALNVEGSIDLDPSPSKTRMATTSNRLGAYTVSVDLEGSYISHKYFPASFISGVSVSPNGSLFTSGLIGSREGSNNIALFLTQNVQARTNFEGSNQPVSLVGNPAAFVVAYNAEGDFLWQHIHQQSGRGFAPTAMVTTAGGDLFIAGHQIERAERANWYQAASGDAFLLKLNANGERIWIRQLTDLAQPLPSSPVVAAMATGPDGSLYLAAVQDAVTQPSIGQTILDLRGGDLIVLKLAQTTGNQVWQYRATSQVSHTGVYDLIVDAGGIAVVGEFFGQVAFDPFNQPLFGQKDSFLLKLSHSGSFRGVFSFGGFGHDRVQRIARDGDRLLLGGFFESGFDMDPFGNSPHPVRAVGRKDAFLVAYQFDSPSIIPSDFEIPAATTGPLFHPADTNQDFRIEIDEITGFAEAVVTDQDWPQGPVDFPSMVRGEFIWKHGEDYTKIGNELPADWVLADEVPADAAQQPVLSGDLDFGTVALGSSQQRALILTNFTDEPMAVFSIHLPDGFTANWAGGNLQPKENRTVMITFTPEEERDYSGAVILNADSADEPPAFLISASGVLDPSAQRQLLLTGDLAFGSTAIGLVETRSLRIRNIGQLPVNVSLIQVPAGFSCTWSGEVPPGKTVTVPVTFAPTQAISYGGQLILQSDVADGPVQKAISGTGAPAARVIHLSGNLTFGTLAVGETSTRFLSITNNGNAPLTVSSISYPSGFSGAWSGTLAKGETKNVTVSFSPTEEKTYGGFIGVNSNADSGPQTFPISGKGGPRLQISGNLSFGNVIVDTTSTRSLTIRNLSSSILTVSGISYPSGFSGAWTGEIPGGSTQVVPVVFAPQAVQAYSGFLGVNTTFGSPTLGVSGSGISAVQLSGDLSFGGIGVGSTFTRSLTIRNLSSQTMIVSGITYPAGFSGAWAGSIPAGMSQTVPIVFAPPALQTFGGFLAVDSNVGSGTRAISGTGQTPSRVVSLSGPFFGSVIVGLSTTRNLRISNSGNSPLTVSGISLPSGFSGSWSGQIPAGGFQDVTITFSPTAVQTYSGALSVQSDATSGSSSRNISGSGIAATRIINLTGSFAFGQVPVNFTASLNLSIRNTGNTPLTVTEVTLPTGFSANWTSGIISPGATQSVVVSFTPTSAISYGGTLIVSSDRTSGTNTIELSGSGFFPAP